MTPFPFSDLHYLYPPANLDKTLYHYQLQIWVSDHHQPQCKIGARSTNRIHYQAVFTLSFIDHPARGSGLPYSFNPLLVPCTTNLSLHPPFFNHHSCQLSGHGELLHFWFSQIGDDDDHDGEDGWSEGKGFLMHLPGLNGAAQRACRAFDLLAFSLLLS